MEPPKQSAAAGTPETLAAAVAVQGSGRNKQPLAAGSDAAAGTVCWRSFRPGAAFAAPDRALGSSSPYPSWPSASTEVGELIFKGYRGRDDDG